MFTLADTLLFKDRNYPQAEETYHRILKIEPNNIDAINSLAYCIKFEAASKNENLPSDLFDTLLGLYTQALAIDSEDIEANFNIGSLYL